MVLSLANVENFFLLKMLVILYFTTLILVSTRIAKFHEQLVHNTIDVFKYTMTKELITT